MVAFVYGRVYYALQEKGIQTAILYLLTHVWNCYERTLTWWLPQGHLACMEIGGSERLVDTDTLAER